MRQASPTGGALGSVTERELDLLQNSMGSLEQSQSKAQFLHNLRRVKNIYHDVIHGPGNGPREKLSYEDDKGEKRTIGGKNYIKRGNEWFEE
jgi:hypothetical protein